MKAPLPQNNARRRAACALLWRGLAALSALVLAAPGCGGKGAPAADAGDPAALDLARARALAAPDATLPPRPEVVQLAEGVEARAAREGAGVRAVELHATAAALLERLWRIDGREQDAKEALDLYAAAAKDLALPGACDAAIRGARLSGDAAHDAQATYAELYRAERRVLAGADGGTSPCSDAVDAELARLAAFRPPRRVLDAIDEGLAGEGAAFSAADGGGARLVRVKPPQVVRIAAWPGQDASRVVIVLDRKAEFRAGDEAVAGGPPETFVELDGVDVAGAPRDTPLDGIVSRVRAEGTTTGARVVLSHAPNIYRRIFYLPEPFRVVIDVARHAPGATLAHGRRAVSRVVLDPGHGGSDPGAIGPGGTREKDVTLDVAHRAAPPLSEAGIQVVLTRDDDHFVSLEERTARANAFGADLFVSIHCNSAPESGRGRRGVETYVLDTSDNEVANKVAARENGVSPHAGAELAEILANMRLADQSQRSTKLAQLLQRAALASLRLGYPDVTDGGVHHAGFYVLVGARMPGALFETSYVSNPTEEQRLATDDYKQRLADAIVNAVKAYREGR